MDSTVITTPSTTISSSSAKEQPATVADKIAQCAPCGPSFGAGFLTALAIVVVLGGAYKMYKKRR